MKAPQKKSTKKNWLTPHAECEVRTITFHNEFGFRIRALAIFSGRILKYILTNQPTQSEFYQNMMQFQSGSGSPQKPLNGFFSKHFLALHENCLTVLLVNRFTISNF